ncbi:TrlF family AAA-like ATPase [Neolewinella antarctica]|uniref:ATPase n=1 Tax=Neolewinella antarctica TaxID=442734 RepID=A0ABX0XFH1_9BACT|nr:hypothetical protein [Neolewinella antarctica]NJC27636.1 putative ATPase [Neolewinella antarctica]
MKRYERGAEWRRWDLHIHTPETNKNPQFEGETNEAKWTRYVKDINEYPSTIAVIGITDYFSVENYFKFKARWEAGDLAESGIECVIPNVELRLSPVTGGGQALNLHCLFDPVIDHEIERRFLAKLKFKDGEKVYDATRASLVALGRAYKGEDYQELGAYIEGVNQFVVSHDSLYTLFEEDMDLRKQCLIVVANGNDGASGVRRHSDFLTNEQSTSLDTLVTSLYKKADAVFSSSITDRNYFLGKKDERHSPAIILEKHKSLMPCLHGCDAHDSNKIFEPTNKRYCWIKADPNFNGLRQVIYEPETRVHIGELCPESPAPRQQIEEVLIHHDDMVNTRIKFNPQLTCIIGGRSTGKSALLAGIAKKLLPAEKAKPNNDRYNDFIAKLADGMSVRWADGVENNEREIEFFYQGYMEQYSRSPKKFDDLVQGIVTTGLDRDPVATFRNFKSVNSAEILEKLKELELLRKKTKEKLAERKTIGDIAGIDKEIERLITRRDAARASQSMSEEEYGKYQELSGELRKIAQREEVIERDQVRLGTLGSPAVRSPDVIDFSEPTRTTLGKAIADAEVEVNRIWAEALAKVRAESAKETAAITERRNDIGANPLHVQGKRMTEENAELERIEKALAVQQDAKLQFNQVTAEMIEITARESLLRREILDLNYKFYDEAKRLSAELTTSLSGGSLRIEAYPRLLLKKYNEDLDYGINLKSQERKDLAVFEPSTATEEADYKAEIREKFDRVLKNEIVLKNQQSAFSFLRKIIGECYVKISYHVRYEGDEYAMMSEGKQAFVVLRLLLDYSDKKCPILIDQPEDDLDNRAIYTDLVSYLKKTKLERQVIVVTHNPNIVVGTDAELVIVANQHGINAPNQNSKKFAYLPGSIEHTKELDFKTPTALQRQGIKEHICEVLEGGVEAFKTREKRYRLHS